MEVMTKVWRGSGPRWTRRSLLPNWEMAANSGWHKLNILLQINRYNTTVLHVRLSWKDSDGDDVVIATDADLKLAIKEMKSSGSGVVRLSISAKDASSGDAGTGVIRYIPAILAISVIN